MSSGSLDTGIENISTRHNLDRIEVPRVSYGCSFLGINVALIGDSGIFCLDCSRDNSSGGILLRTSLKDGALDVSMFRNLSSGINSMIGSILINGASITSS
jgi:hypothetical protein